MRIETHYISDIHESEYNPRVALDSTSKEYKAIKKSIEDYGFVEPIVVNDITMNCIGGHQRLAIMKDMGEEQIDCAMVHIEDPDKEKALCIALNKIKGDWDNEKLDLLLSEPEIREFELGFDNIEVTLDAELNNSDLELNDYSEDENDEDDDSYSMLDDETGNTQMVIKIGVYHFNINTSEYEEMLASIRDEGIFERAEIIEELKRRLCSD